MPAKPVPRPPAPSAHPVRDAADALHRAAMECCHQHERIATLRTLGADDREFEGAWDMADLAEAQMVRRTESYEEIAAAGRGDAPEEWWHAANGLWMACREYSRRYSASNDAATRRRRHGAAELGEITLEYELEVSARLAVKQALGRYASAPR